jgi:hypothetical protein
MEDVITNIKDKVASKLADQPKAASEFKRTVDKLSLSEDKKGYLEYLKDKNDISEIYKLIKNKKLSNNQIRKKIKEYLNDPEDLRMFLSAILDTKTTKKEEETEATGAGGAGQFSAPLFSTTKGDVTKTVKTVRENVEKVEATEATGSASSGQYNQPAIWAKSLSKKDWKGASTKYMPGAKRVQVKKKCKKFPYCNQGDIKALKIFENQSVQNAIDSVSGRYGIDKEYISEIVFQEIRKRQK